ncbi:MAG TPA: urease accessory protein UreF, partial [Coleofasciculaceae cyanobacterium]
MMGALAMIAAQNSLLQLLQLASPALPVGAYSYSEGLETLVEQQQIINETTLQHWIEQEVQWGAAGLDAAVMIRAWRAVDQNEPSQLVDWNTWLSAARETEELRLQSWQMGRSLLRLLQDLEIDGNRTVLLDLLAGAECNFAIVFGLAASLWNIEQQTALLGYLHSWATNLISAGIKLIPLGQTAGQRLLLTLQPTLEQVTQKILSVEDED